MNLINKIDSLKVSKDYTGERSEYLTYVEGIEYTLKEITPKVAIDFAKWVLEKDIIKSVFGGFLYNQEVRYTEEQLFEEFLKDYEYE